MHRQQFGVDLSGQNLDRPVVRRDRGDLVVVDPLAAGEAEPGLAGHERRCVSFANEFGAPAGAEQQDVTGLDFDALPGGRSIEVLRRDHRAGLEPLDTFESCDVEEHAASDDALGLLVDRTVLRAMGSHVARWEAVVELIVVVHVGQPVPLRGCLEGHEHVVVGVVERARELLVGTGLRHQSNGVDPSATRLRALRIEGDSKVEDGAALHQPARGDDPLGRDQIDGASLVGVAPSAPVPQPGSDLAKILHIYPSFRLNDPVGILTRKRHEHPLDDRLDVEQQVLYGEQIGVGLRSGPLVHLRRTHGGCHGRAGRSCLGIGVS